jgi:carboxyl-terminal processing protease
MTFTALKSTRHEIGSPRPALSGLALALGLAAVTTGLLGAGSRAASAEELLRTAFFIPAGVETLPGGFSGGASPGFRNGAPEPLTPFSTDEGLRPRTRDPNNGAPAAPAPTPAGSGRPAETRTEADAIHERLTRRYRDPVVVRLVQSLTVERALSLYNETSRLIDGRHIQPSTHEARTRQAVRNLSLAVENPAFVQANRLNVGPAQVRGFQDALRRLVDGRAVRNSADAQSVLRSAIDLAGRQIGLRPGAVAMEFVYGATESLDRYSAFTPADNARQPSASLADHVVGIGVEIKPHEQGLVVVRVLRGGPAEQAGLRADDVIVSINGRRLAGQGLEFAVDQIAGREGTTLQLAYVRDGRPATTVTLTRRRVTIESVSEVRMLDEADRVGYIKLDSFAKASVEEMERAMWNLHSQGMQSLVFDLRGNPGGLLTTAVELTNKFLPHGTIVTTRGRTTADVMSERATWDRTWSVPLVVLIDEGSASASEIFAAAIQENQRGVVVGRRSYGKGSVQTHFPLTSVSGNLKLTTASFYSPNGRSMAESGVTPDIPVEKPATASGGRDADIEAALSVAKNPRLKQIAHALAVHNPRLPAGR